MSEEYAGVQELQEFRTIQIRKDEWQIKIFSQDILDGTDRSRFCNS